MKKYYIILTGVIVVIVIYLFAAHFSIYKRISLSGLKASDVVGKYEIANSMKNTKNFKITVLGDSLTSGVGVEQYQDAYPYVLAKKLITDNRAIELTSHAYPGAKTSGLMDAMLSAAIADQPDVVLVLIGVNDIHGNVSKERFTKNYQEILHHLKTETTAKIFAISIPFIGTKTLLLPPFYSYFKGQTVAFNDIIKQLALDNNITYIDLYSQTKDMFNDPSMYSADSFHPSANGYALWANIIYANLNL
ncbi:MAG: SGNH/GDSL hydrolase family protein [Candidatus Falkowbacteria bacterium]